jgi:fumarate hydratase subunit alpha
MRQITVKDITEAVKKMCIEANCLIGEEILAALKRALQVEESPTGKEVLQQILENNRLARKKMMPICQDTGTAVVFAELGQEVHISGGNLYEAINEGVRQGYTEGYLRKSIVTDPLSRKNTGDNTPAAIHLDLVPGDKLKISILPKGGGSENMSAFVMLPPSAGVEGVKKFVVEAVKRAGSNPCPPVVVGVGIGGTFEGAALLAKKSHLRPLGSKHPDPSYDKLEKELLTLINNTGIGPQGLGGRVTALAVHINTGPCHLTALPVAVNLNCHAVRHKSIVL